MSVERNIGQYSKLAVATRDMFAYRSKYFEDLFLKKLDEIGENKLDFKRLLKEDAEHFLPSKVDVLYHRNILTSNMAETVFSVLKKRNCNKKQPFLTNIEFLMSLSMTWLKKSSKEKITIPKLLSKRIDKSIGKVALRHIINEQKKAYEIKDDSQCNCISKITTKLPCCHDLQSIEEEKIVIEPEYLRIDFKFEDNLELNESECKMEEVKIKEEMFDLHEVVNELDLTEGSDEIENFMAFVGIQWLRERKLGSIKSKLLRYNIPPHILKYSHVCTSYRNYWNKKKIKFRRFIITKPRKRKEIKNKRVKIKVVDIQKI